MKKVLIILLCLILAGAGGGGTYYFYRQNQNQIEQNAALTAQNLATQQRLNAIGEMTTVYQVSRQVYSGKPCDMGSIIEVSVPVSSLGTSTITDKSMLEGKCWKINIKPGTTLSTDLLMEDADVHEKLTRELTFTSVPVTTKVGDYVDLRIMMPNGEEYTILNHKRVERLFNTTITFFVSEEENMLINSAIADEAQYSGSVMIYLTKYLEPGNDNTVAFYPVSHYVENFVKFNVNIKDTTRLINPTLRDHIDEVLVLYTDSDNSAASQAFISALNVQYASQLAMQNDWIQQNTDENGVFNAGDNVSQVGTKPSGGTTNNTGTTETVDDTGSFDQQVGDAMDSLEDSLEDLDAIQ